MPVRLLPTIVLAALLLGAPPALGATPTPAPAPALGAPRAEPGSALALTVTYAGHARWATRFHATPPNAGGAPDTNDAHDTSTQHWTLRFRRPLRVPACAGRRADCPEAAAVRGVSGATGATRATSTIDHRHVDGLYRELDATERCRISAGTRRGARLRARVAVRYHPRLRAFAVVAHIPVGDVLATFPGCPGHTDGIDRILDTYATPGFSFVTGWGPERWFVSRTAYVPAARLAGARPVRLRLGPALGSIPPADCAVVHPEYERCHTGGAWSGVLTLTPRAGARRAAISR